MAPRSNQRDQVIRDSITEIPATSAFAERHYTVAEVAAMWNLSKDAIRRLFQNEPGVLVLANRTRGSKRRYVTLRVPEFVIERVHRRCSLAK